MAEHKYLNIDGIRYLTNKYDLRYAKASHSHKKSDITDFPTSMPASDVSAWAKASTKPTYTAAEVGLDRVDNTSDEDKPISRAVQTALDGKSDKHNHPYLLLSGGTLNDNATIKLSTYGTRSLTLTGNSISADMSKETGGWAGNFSSVKDPAGATTTLLGWYGDGAGLIHIYMGGAYNDPYMKMTKAGLFTFKNLVTANGGLQSNVFKAPTSNGGSTYGMGTNGQVLKSNGSTLYWGNDNNTTYGVASTTADGLMSKTDKSNLDTIINSFNNDDSNTTIDTIKEVLKAFENAPEGTDIANALAGKVDKVSGKGLSTNDFTTAYKNKLDGIASGATAVTESTVSGWGFTKNAGTVTSVKVGSTSYNPSSGVVSLPAYPTNTWRGIQNNLTSTSTTESLSAYQGKLLNEKFADYLPLTGGTITAGNTLILGATSNANSSKLKWGTVNSKTPYFGYASDQTDGTFVWSTTGTTYQTGLAIGGGSGNLLWKGVKVATVNDIPSGVTVDTSLSSTSSNAIANKTVYNAIDTIRTDVDTLFTSKSDEGHTHPYLPLAGGTLTGNLSGKYITGTWLQTTASTETASYANIAVLDSSGWVYKRSKANLKTDLGVGQIKIGSTYYNATLSGTTLALTSV